MTTESAQRKQTKPTQPQPHLAPFERNALDEAAEVLGSLGYEHSNIEFTKLAIKLRSIGRFHDIRGGKKA